MSVRRGAGSWSRSGAASNNNNEVKEECEEEPHRQWLVRSALPRSKTPWLSTVVDAQSMAERQVERTQLLEELARVKLELAHAREEKLELEESFRRLDREIADGYNLSARKDKKIRIAELLTKNQKVC